MLEINIKFYCKLLDVNRQLVLYTLSFIALSKKARYILKITWPEQMLKPKALKSCKYKSCTLGGIDTNINELWVFPQHYCV